MKNWKSPAEVLHLVRLRKHWRWRLWQEKCLFLSELFDSVWKFTLCILKIFVCICIKVWLLVCTYHRAYVGVREDIIGCLSLPFFLLRAQGYLAWELHGRDSPASMSHLLAGALTLQVCALLPHSGDPNSALPTCTASILPTETSSQSTLVFWFYFVFKVTKISMLPKQGLNQQKKNDRKCPHFFFFLSIIFSSIK